MTNTIIHLKRSCIRPTENNGMEKICPAMPLQTGIIESPKMITISAKKNFMTQKKKRAMMKTMILRKRANAQRWSGIIGSRI